MGSGDRFIFVDECGYALPEWLQIPLRAQALRLARSFAALRDSADLQNLLDNVGQRVLRRIEAGAAVVNLEAYIGTAARHAAYDAIGKGKLDALGQLAARALADKASAPRGDAGLRLMLNEVGGVLSALEKQILVRFVLYGEKHGEIATALGLSATAVRSRYSRSLERLRKHFGVAESLDRIC